VDPEDRTSATQGRTLQIEAGPPSRLVEDRPQRRWPWRIAAAVAGVAAALAAIVARRRRG